ncbi:hypothetical protein [Arthrobacter sp. ISL-65]|uniref:hypothetical protein n=1 Tax=Arthrobacter sp. ISL-65 TaxID=2819112 RepID=UPI0035A868DA
MKQGDYKLAFSDIFGGNAFLPVLFLAAVLISGQPVLAQAHSTDIYLTALAILLTLIYALGLIFRPARKILGNGRRLSHRPRSISDGRGGTVRRRLCRIAPRGAIFPSSTSLCGCGATEIVRQRPEAPNGARPHDSERWECDSCRPRRLDHEPGRGRGGKRDGRTRADEAAAAAR